VERSHDELIQQRGRELVALVAGHLPVEFDVGPGVDLWEPIGTGLLSRMTTTLGYVLDLHRSSLEADASTLVRSLYEHAVHFAWLAADPSPARIERWQRHDLVQRLRADDDMKRHGVETITPARRSEFAARISAMRGAPLKLEELAVAADKRWGGKLTGMGKHTEVLSFSGWYASLYRAFSTMAHPSEIGLYRVTEEIRRGRVRVQLERPSSRQGPYGMATFVYGIALLAAGETLAWPDSGDVLEIFEHTT
jgi:hypothetical protein